MLYTFYILYIAPPIRYFYFLRYKDIVLFETDNSLGGQKR